MTYTHEIVNGIAVPLSPEKIAEFKTRDAAWTPPQPALAPTKEQLLAQLQTLQAQIQALE